MLGLSITLAQTLVEIIMVTGLRRHHDLREGHPTVLTQA
jgi:hypothetical protein